MSVSQFQGDAIFWVEVEKIVPNPYQPRREFDEERLQDLAESVRMYGVLQPLTVTRREVIRDDGGLSVEYELIAGERRHRASKIAGLKQVPVIIRSGPEDAKIKLELAIIENLQREDLNAVDRAKAFRQLAEDFSLTNTEIAKKMGKSREYVSNTMRLLGLSDEMLQAIVDGRISEGHARPLLMLKDKPEEQLTLFKEITFKKMAVREAERIARGIAKDKARKKPTQDPRLKHYEQKFAESFGTRVHIEERKVGGQVVIDFFSPEDLETMLDIVNASLLRGNHSIHTLMERYERKENNEAQALSSHSIPAQHPISQPVVATTPISIQTPEAVIVTNSLPVFQEQEKDINVFQPQSFRKPEVVMNTSSQTENLQTQNNEVNNGSFYHDPALVSQIFTTPFEMIKDSFSNTQSSSHEALNPSHTFSQHHPSQETSESQTTQIQEVGKQSPEIFVEVNSYSTDSFNQQTYPSHTFEQHTINEVNLMSEPAQQEPIQNSVVQNTALQKNDDEDLYSISGFTI